MLTSPLITACCSRFFFFFLLPFNHSMTCVWRLASAQLHEPCEKRHISTQRLRTKGRAKREEMIYFKDDFDNKCIRRQYFFFFSPIDTIFRLGGKKKKEQKAQTTVHNRYLFLWKRNGVELLMRSYRILFVS